MNSSRKQTSNGVNTPDAEKIIAEQFTSLPRKPTPAPDKEAVWMRIQTYLRRQRKAERVFLRTRLIRSLATALVVIIALIAVNKGVDAAKSSLPGEALYPLKIASEKVEVAFATTDSKKVEVLTSHAQNRLDEVSRLVEENQKPEIVTKTLEALKTTTEEVVAISQAQPELTDGAIELAQAQEKVLIEVEDKAETAEVKEAVQNAISSSRESILKLTSKPGEGDVEGTATATSTPSTTPPQITLPKRVKKETPDAIIESQIQVHGSFTVEEEVSDNLPEILPEPTGQ